MECPLDKERFRGKKGLLADCQVKRELGWGENVLGGSVEGQVWTHTVLAFDLSASRCMPSDKSPNHSEPQSLPLETGNNAHWSVAVRTECADFHRTVCVHLGDVQGT